MFWTSRAIVLICIVSLLSCADGSAPGQGAGGSGGLAGFGGGAGGDAGGDAGEGGGSGGVGGGTGEGGLGGDGPSWLLDETTWRELPELADVETEARVWAGSKEKLRYPPFAWTTCGEACEQVELDWTYGSFWEASLGQVVNTSGPTAWISFTQALGNGFVRRLVDLGTGSTVAVLRIEHVSGEQILTGDEPWFAGYYGESGTSFIIGGKGKVVLAGFDPHSMKWEFKLPWSHGEGILTSYCTRFDLDTSPPSLLWGCSNVVRGMIMPGSNEMTTLSDARFGGGAGHAGVAAWSELNASTPRSSSVVKWTPADGLVDVVDSMAGVACGVAVSADRIIGFRGRDTELAPGCEGRLVDPELWWVSRDGGPVESLRLTTTRTLGIVRAVAWGDFVAAIVTKHELNDRPTHERMVTWLIRLSDGAIREVSLIPRYEYADSLLSLDDRYLYVADNHETEDTWSMSHLFRYSLADFEQIGRDPLSDSE